MCHIDADVFNDKVIEMLKEVSFLFLSEVELLL